MSKKLCTKVLKVSEKLLSVNIVAVYDLINMTDDLKKLSFTFIFSIKMFPLKDNKGSILFPIIL